MFPCQYCGLTYGYAVCPYDGTTLSDPYQRSCMWNHDLTQVPQQYRVYLSYSPYQTVAACPNCRTPYLYTYLPPELKMEFNRQRQARGCFIATSALGSHLHPHVQSLREFRDNVLLRSRHKDTFEKLLNFYYRFSPPIARAMVKHKPVKLFLRYTLVYPVVFSIKFLLPIFDIILGIEKDAKRRNWTK